MRLRLRVLLATAALVLVTSAAAVCFGAQTAPLFLNAREKVSLSDDAVVYAFAPTEDGGYAFCTFSGDQARVVATLYEDDLEIAHGEGADISLEAELLAERAYTLVLTGEGETAVEVMRRAHGRCYELPISLDGAGTRYTKTVTRPRDTHWFSFKAAADGLYTVRSETAADAPLDTQAYLLSEDGVEIAYSDDAAFPGDPNFCLRARLAGGETYFVRVNAFSNATGVYRLALVAPEGGEAEVESVSLSALSLSLEIGQDAALSAALAPDDAYRDVIWYCSDYAVARVSPEGVVTAVGPGSATVTALGYGGAEAKCLLSVKPIAVESVRFEQAETRVSVGASASLALAFLPENASDQSASYVSADPDVATVDGEGVVTGVREGETVITAVTRDGASTAEIAVIVSPPAPSYRALVMGEQIYVDGRTRVGAINSAQGFADMLGTQNIDGQRYEVTLRIDSTREDFVKAISAAFGAAEDGDVSLLYVNCHGDYVDGVAYLELHDGSRVTARQLASLLKDVKGEVALLIDCCRSGGFLGDRDALRFGETLLTSFSSPLGRFHVLTSASCSQDSYRIGEGGEVTEAAMATVFARAVCEGAGWDLIRDKAVRPRADTNDDGVVTMRELYLYARKRVYRHLEGTGVTQTVQLRPEGDTLAILGR